MKKKFVAVAACAFALCMAFALAGCSGGSSSSASASSSSSDSSASAASSDSSSSAASSDSSASTSSASTSSGATVVLEGDFIVGFDQDYPPYGFVGDDGEFTGFDLELAQEVCDRNGWTFVAEPINWDTKQTLIDSGAISCIWNGFTMEGREDDYSFTDPYMDNSQVIMVKAGSDIKALTDLEGKTVGTQADSAALKVLTEGNQADLAATFAALEERSDYNTAVLELESGALDALACDLSIAAYNMAANPDKYVLLDETLSDEHYAVGFKKGNDALADAVNDTLKEMAADGFVEKLCDKYAEDGISFDNWVL